LIGASLRRLLASTLTVVAFTGIIACGGDGGPTAPPPPPAATRIMVLEGTLTFGDVPIGGSFDRTMRILSTGTETLTVTGMTGPDGYTADWTNGTIPAGTVRVVTLIFRPTENRTYNGTITVNANHTSGTNTLPISGRGLRELFRRSGTGDSVFDMPLDVARVRIIGTYTGNSSNFVVRIGGRLLVNELLGTFWNQTRYDGTLLTGGGGVVAITNSSGVAWSFEEVR
jgi:Abnormal spindle-like microcephaly-assoc'd, ASPM-SPD-2-Hydin